MPEFFTPEQMQKLCQPMYKPFAKAADYAQLPGKTKAMQSTYGRSVFAKVKTAQLDQSDLEALKKESEGVIRRLSAFAPLFRLDHEDKVKRMGNLRAGVVTPAFEQAGFVIPRDGVRYPPSDKVKKEIVAYWKPFFKQGQQLVTPADLRFVVNANLCYPIISNLGINNTVIFSVFAMQALAIKQGKYTIADLIRAEESRYGPRFAAQFSRVAMKGKPLRIVLKDGSYVEQYGLAGADRLVAGVEKKFHFILREYTKPFVKGALLSGHHAVDDVKTAQWIRKCQDDGYEVFSWDSKQFDLHHGSERLKAYIDIFCEVSGAPKDVCLAGSFSPQMIKSTFGTWIYDDPDWSQLLSGDPLTTIMNLIGVVTMVASFCEQTGNSWSYDGNTSMRFKSWGDDMVVAVKQASTKKQWIDWCTKNTCPGEEEPRIAFLGKWFDSSTKKMCYYDESLIKGIDPSATESLKTVWSRRLGIVARLQLVSDPEKLFSFMERNWFEEAWGPRFTMQDLNSVATEAALKCSGQDLNNMVRALYSGLGLEEVLAAGIKDPLVRALQNAGVADDEGFVGDMMSITIDDVDAATQSFLKMGQIFGSVAKRVLTEPSQDWLELVRSNLKLRGGSQSPIF